MAEQSESRSCRVIVIGRDGTEVLLVPRGEDYTLPSVKIPRWQRVVENLTTEIKNEWGEEVVCLFEPPAESPADGDFPGYQSAEHMRSCGSSTMPTRWVSLSMLGGVSMADARDQAAIQKTIEVCKGETGGIRGPFAHLGWFRDLRDWIESVIRPMGFHLNGKFRQVNASGKFSLIRFETDGSALWFKAVGEPNQKEFAITQALAELVPHYLPPVLATRPDCNGWLSNEIQGKPLSDVPDELVWVRAVVVFARLQIQSIDYGTRILAAGARDLSSGALSKLINPFISEAAQLMDRQTKVPPVVLNRKDLLVLADSLQRALDAAEAIGIPDALGHLDLNPGNIIVSECRCAFIDWAEAYVGNPFFSGEYLLEHARRAFGLDSAVPAKLREAYSKCWDGALSPSAIRDALVVAPLLAMFAYAVGNEEWKATAKVENAGTAAFWRSLVRRMHREAAALTDRGVPFR
jgi:Phosphotransferase enzyme family